MDWHWRARLDRHLPQYCPNCESPYNSSGNSLLSVSMVLDGFGQRKRALRIQYSQDLQPGDLEQMDQEIADIKHNYDIATTGGPNNTAEIQLRDDYEDFKKRWENDLVSRRVERIWRDVHREVNPLLMNQIEGAIEEPMPGFPYPSSGGQSSSNQGPQGSSSSSAQDRSQQGSSSGRQRGSGR